MSREELRCHTHNRGGPIITRHVALNGMAGSVDNVKSGLVPSQNGGVGKRYYTGSLSVQETLQEETCVIACEVQLPVDHLSFSLITNCFSHRQ